MLFKTIFIFFSQLLIVIGGTSCMLNNPQNLSGEMHELFNDVRALNKYAQKQQLKIKKAIIEKYELNGLILPKAEFDNTLWKNIKAKDSVLNDVIISDSRFENVDFSTGVFKSCIFKNSHFIDTIFDDSNFEETDFVNCTFHGSSFTSITGDVVLDYSTLERVSFSKSEIELSINSCNIKYCKFYSIKTIRLIINDCIFNKVDFSSSTIENINIDNLKAEKGIFFDNSTIHEFNINNSLSFDKITLNRSKVQQILAKNSKFQGIGFVLNGTDANSIVFKNCSEYTTIAPAEATIKKILIQNTKMRSLFTFDSVIDYFSIIDCAINYKSYWGTARIKRLDIKNLYLDGEHDFTDLEIGEISATGIKKGNTYKTIPSNMKSPF
jgi:uncharacterized protein YjbI with pentapeptide repeats